MVEKLIGLWRGGGSLIGKNINYTEELTILPFTTPKGQCYEWVSKTWKDPEGFAMHKETGMLRAFSQEGNMQMELMLSHPFGLVEVENGELLDDQLELRSSGIARTPTCANPSVTHIRRLFSVTETTLKYQLFLTLINKEEYLHLEASLDKIQ